MTVGDAVARTLGLAVFSLRRAFVRGGVQHDVSLYAAPSVHLFVARGARVAIGRRVVLRYGADICAVGRATVTIGDGTYIGPRCMLSAHADIRIGTDCLFGPDVKIFDNNHYGEAGTGIQRGRFRVAPVSIGDNVWIGCNVVVLKGVQIGDNAVIGAGCVIRKDVPAGAVVVGGVDDQTAAGTKS